MIEALEQRTVEYFEIDPVDVAISNQSVPTHLDYVCCWIEDGQTINELADALKCPPQWIGAHLRKTFGEEAADARLVASRARASHQIAEKALSVSDEKAETSTDVARNGLRARSRQWLAERWNPQQYGQKQQTNVSISVTSLHLTALQHAGNRVTGSTNMVESVPVPPSIPAQVSVVSSDGSQG